MKWLSHNQAKVSHIIRAYLGTPPWMPGWDAGPSQGFHPAFTPWCRCTVDNMRVGLESRLLDLESSTPHTLHSKEINPNSKLHVTFFHVQNPDYVQPDLQKDSCSSIRTRSQHEQIASRDVIVTEVDQNPISWVVLSFPVMTLQFVKVKYVDGDSVLTRLINYSDCLQHDELPTTMSWNSSCQIKLQDGNEYKVFWKWTKTLNELHENWEEISTSESEVSHISETTSNSSEKSVKSVTE